MNGAHLHLMINHFPVVGLVLSTIFLVVSSFLDQELLKRTGYILMIVFSLLTVPALLTGEMAEETIEAMPGISEVLIENHEDAAEISAWLVLISGILAVINLVISLLSQHPPKSITKALIIFAIIATGGIIWTANLGGQIRHPEVRYNFENLNQ